jgi:hypothetical protein
MLIGPLLMLRFGLLRFFVFTAFFAFGRKGLEAFAVFFFFAVFFAAMVFPFLWGLRIPSVKSPAGFFFFGRALGFLAVFARFFIAFGFGFEGLKSRFLTIWTAIIKILLSSRFLPP